MALAVSSLLLFVRGAAALAGPELQDAQSGTVLYLNRGGIWQLNMATEQREPFLEPNIGTITHVSHSWDRSRVAYSVDVRGQGFELVESIIVVASADGSNATGAVSEKRTGATVEWPSWSPDGTRLAYTKTPFGSRTQRVEEVDLQTGARTLVTEAGTSPSYAPDGETIVFAAPFGQTWSISTISPHGGDARVVVPSEGFEDLDHPLFARSGEYIVFLGAAALQASMPVGAPASTLAFASGFGAVHPGSLADFDLWMVRPDGSGLRKVVELLSPQPFLAWSPDGRSLASRDRFGLRVIDMAGGTGGESLRWVAGQISGGPISWGW